MFVRTNFKKDSNKSKWEYSVCGSCSIVAFDGVGSWSFGNEFARNVVIFGVVSISSYHADNQKNNF